MSEHHANGPGAAGDRTRSPEAEPTDGPDLDPSVPAGDPARARPAVRAVVFDLDGTLVATDQFWIPAARAATHAFLARLEARAPRCASPAGVGRDHGTWTSSPLRLCRLRRRGVELAERRATPLEGRLGHPGCALLALTEAASPGDGPCPAGC